MSLIISSLLIPCHNELACTRLCLQSILAHARPSFEIILIDNAATDGTTDHLAGFADSSGVPVQLITNPTNRCYPAAINQGLGIASAGRGWLGEGSSDQFPDSSSALRAPSPRAGEGHSATAPTQAQRWRPGGAGG